MKHIRLNFLPLLPLIFSTFCLAEEELVFLYQPVIEADCRINSKGKPLNDVASILIQERFNSHQKKQADEDYFTTPARRAEITQMLARGETNGLEEIILKGRDPVLMVFVDRNPDGQLKMRLGMRARDQENFDPDQFNEAAARDAKNTSKETIEEPQGELDSLEIGPKHPDYNPIITLLQTEANKNGGEPVKMELSLYLFDGWAKADGIMTTASGKDPVNEEAGLFFELSHTAVLRKTEGRWKLLKYIVAGDITAAIEIPENFPDVPKELFPRLSPEITGKKPETTNSKNPENPDTENMEFIDGESNLRAGAGTGFAVIFQPAKGATGIVLEKNGKWIHLQMANGATGWVHQSNIRKLK
jgi:hypothetical protein